MAINPTKLALSDWIHKEKVLKAQNMMGRLTDSAKNAEENAIEKKIGSQSTNQKASNGVKGPKFCRNYSSIFRGVRPWESAPDFRNERELMNCALRRSPISSSERLSAPD